MTSQLQKLEKAEKMQHMSFLQDLLANRLCVLLEKEAFNLESLQNNDQNSPFTSNSTLLCSTDLNVSVWEAHIGCTS